MTPELRTRTTDLGLRARQEVLTQETPPAPVPGPTTVSCLLQEGKGWSVVRRLHTEVGCRRVFGGTDVGVTVDSGDRSGTEVCHTGIRQGRADTGVTVPSRTGRDCVND